MLVESNNNYNPLGRLGPLHPRPEYRPRTGTEAEKLKTDEGGQTGVGTGREKSKDASSKTVAASGQNLDGRLNLSAAKALTESVAEAISRLEPLACNCGPHGRLNPATGLMFPRYV
ncbi:MAG: hypothetical protein LBT47_06745 [Deltaproteobacteria bacterium]|jgi:hypothetical protein|nr:hypothetical protein [Deltaproteobacteria bacterium]